MLENDFSQFDFSLEEARQFGERGEVEEWVHSFLLGPGDNKPLSDGLKLQPRFWRGPLKLSLAELEMTCGPGLEFHEEQADWDKWTDGICSAILSGVDMPPLLAEYTDRRLKLSDGNHRCGGLKKANVEEYWVIVWYSSQSDYDEHGTAM